MPEDGMKLPAGSLILDSKKEDAYDSKRGLFIQIVLVIPAIRYRTMSFGGNFS